MVVVAHDSPATRRLKVCRRLLLQPNRTPTSAPKVRDSGRSSLTIHRTRFTTKPSRFLRPGMFPLTAALVSQADSSTWARQVQALLVTLWRFLAVLRS